MQPSCPWLMHGPPPNSANPRRAIRSSCRCVSTICRSTSPHSASNTCTCTHAPGPSLEAYLTLQESVLTNSRENKTILPGVKEQRPVQTAGSWGLRSPAVARHRRMEGELNGYSDEERDLWAAGTIRPPFPGSDGQILCCPARYRPRNLPIPVRDLLADPHPRPHSISPRSLSINP